MLALLILLAAGVITSPLSAQSDHRAILRDKLRADLEAIADDFDGVLGAQLVDLTDSTAVAVNQRLVFPQGSAIKIPDGSSTLSLEDLAVLMITLSDNTATNILIDAVGMLARCELPVSKASCERIRGILEIPKGDAVRDPVPASVRIAFKPGSLEGVATVWAYVELPDRPYVLVAMTNYGGDGDEAIRQISEVAYGYFSKLARATPYGTRVPLEIIRRQ